MAFCTYAFSVSVMTRFSDCACVQARSRSPWPGFGPRRLAVAFLEWSSDYLRLSLRLMFGGAPLGTVAFGAPGSSEGSLRVLRRYQLSVVRAPAVLADTSPVVNGPERGQ